MSDTDFPTHPKKELVNRDAITIVTRFGGMKSELLFTMNQEMRKSDGKVASTLVMTAGIFDLVKRKLIPPSQHWQQALQGEGS